MREFFITDLVKEVLGPRNGAQETMADNPTDEYITGVLAPLTGTPMVAQRDVESESNLAGESSDTEEEGDASEPEISAPSFSPVLNPQLRPHSIGLSFVFRPDDQESFVRVCITWARYFSIDSGYWQRRKRLVLIDIPQMEDRIFWLSAAGHATDSPQPDSEVSCLPKRICG